MSTVRIIYKSGAEATFKCTNFKTIKQGGDLIRVEYEDASPRPLFIGIDDIAAVWVVKG